MSDIGVLSLKFRISVDIFRSVILIGEAWRPAELLLHTHIRVSSMTFKRSKND